MFVKILCNNLYVKTVDIKILSLSLPDDDDGTQNNSNNNNNTEEGLSPSAWAGIAIARAAGLTTIPTCSSLATKNKTPKYS